MTTSLANDIAHPFCSVMAMRRSPDPPPEVPAALSVETARWAVDAARRVVEEFHRAAGRERPDWLD